LLRSAAVELLGAPASGQAQEKVLRRIDLALTEGGQEAEGTFDVRPEETAYRIVVEDEYGFENVPPPRRGIRIVAEDPPQVTLLREEFGPDARWSRLIGRAGDFEVEGMPVPAGGRIRIAYTCIGPYGLGTPPDPKKPNEPAVAWLRFRVLKKAAESSAESPSEEDARWLSMPLTEVQGSEKPGPFDPRRGAFRNSDEKAQVQFHAVPSDDPEKILGRTVGGGRFDFQTNEAIPDGKGAYVKILPGDQLEYYVEVFADRDPASGRPSGRSEVRRKLFVTGPELVRWLEDTVQEERRIRQLEARQRGVFDGD
jgi:hypothetical protein